MLVGELCLQVTRMRVCVCVCAHAQACMLIQE